LTKAVPQAQNIAATHYAPSRINHETRLARPAY